MEQTHAQVRAAIMHRRPIRIAFCSFRDGDYDIYTMRLDGSEVRKLTNSHGNDAHPIWSPDGNWILFSSSRNGFKDEELLDEWGPQPYGDLYVMHADGTGVRHDGQPVGGSHAGVASGAGCA